MGISIIPPALNGNAQRPAPAWLKFRLRGSFASGTPTVPNDFLYTPTGLQPAGAVMNLANMTWVTNATAPYVAGYGRSALRWTYQAVSTHRAAVVLPPYAGCPPLLTPFPPAAQLGELSELRFVARMAYTGGVDVGDIHFSGFAFSDWNAFGTGGTGLSPWCDLAAASYCGLLINRASGVFQVAVKRVGVVTRVVLALPPSIAPGTLFAVDHRFQAATQFSPARYSCRINGVVAAEISFDSAAAPNYTAINQGIAPMLYGTYFNINGQNVNEDIASLDVVAGPGALAFPIE